MHKRTQMSWRQAGLLLLVLLVTSFPASAFAQKSGPTPKYFMLPTQSVRDSVTSIVPERIGELSREQVAKDDRIELMPSFEDLKKQLGGSTATIAEAEALYTSGIGLLTAGEDKKAAETFKRAVEMMEQNLGDLTNFDILADAIANLALANHNAGFDLDARKGMQAYAHIRPGATLDAEKFPKELIETFEQEASKVKKAGNGVLKITADGEALVTIDGVERGKTPLTVRDVGFGYHYMVVRGAGKPYTEKIRVRGKKKTQSFKADVKGGSGETGGTPTFYAEMLNEIKSGTFSSSTLGPYLKELCSQTGAEHVGFIVMFKQSSKYVAAPFAYSAGNDQLVRGDDVEFNIELSNLLVGVSTLADSVVSLALDSPEDRVVTDVQLGAPAVAVATPPTETTTTTTTPTGTPTEGNSGEVATSTTLQPPPDVEKKSGNTWKYVGIAAGSVVGVGLIAGAVYLLASGGGGEDGFSAEVQW